MPPAFEPPYTANDLQYEKRHFLKSAKPFVAAALMALVLLLDAIAVCEPLHEWVHHDAHEAGHECAATLFAHGHVDTATPDIAVIPAAQPFKIFRAAPISVFSTTVEQLPSGRAPPVSVSSPA